MSQNETIRAALLAGRAITPLEALIWALEQIDDDLSPDHIAALDAAWATVNKAEGELNSVTK